MVNAVADRANVGHQDVEESDHDHRAEHGTRYVAMRVFCLLSQCCCGLEADVTEYSQHDAYGEITALRNRAWAEWYGGEASPLAHLRKYDYNPHKAKPPLQRADD